LSPRSYISTYAPRIPELRTIRFGSLFVAMATNRLFV
jgi:hypothetical protein